MPEAEVVSLGIQIAEALEAAHEQGIVHRDLKPENIVVTPRGRLKILDFGLAKLLARDGSATGGRALTGRHAVLGTLVYMAPEQITGDAVDARADLYALGAVLYELATGRHPLEGKPANALMYAIVNTRPTPPRQRAPGLSAGLEALVLQLLEKAPERRPASARDVADALRALAAPARTNGADGEARRIESLAVLPLVNLSNDPDQEFFTDGMTEALIAGLAQLRALRVISRTSAMQYKGARQPLPDIARALSVDAVVEGGVLRSGERVRVSANLIEAATDRLRWSRTYERSVGDVLALQGEIARAIAEEIRIEISPGERRRLAAGGRTVKPEAYEAYLKGRYLWNRRTPDELRRGIEQFQRAIELDPGYAEALAGLADSYSILGDINAMRPTDAFALARTAVERALAIDDGIAEAHTSLGFLRAFHEWNWAGAAASYERAIALNPGYATARQWYAEYLISQGRFDEALASARRARELDPLAFIFGTTVGDTLFFARRYDDAIAELRATLDMEPRFVPAHRDLGRALIQRGRVDEGIEEFLTAARLERSDPTASPGLAHAYAVGGRADEARTILKGLEARASTGLVSLHAIGVIHLALGEKEAALDWLERAYAERDRALVWAKVHPRLDPLRDQPRFAAILKNMGLAGT
jgi:eukaryotic-like serine/threonine-protein kinase